jgi:hypothetical protein
MTYRELMKMIAELPEANKDDEVTIYVSPGSPLEEGEYYEAQCASKSDEGTLPDGHLIIVL